MGERSLRGSRLGSVSYETERNTNPIERQYAEYRCASGHLFTVPFADDAELPDTWECKFDGSAAKLVGGAEPAPKKGKPPRTHWDMLLERRSVEDLEEGLPHPLDGLWGVRHGPMLAPCRATHEGPGRHPLPGPWHVCGRSGPGDTPGAGRPV